MFIGEYIDFRAPYWQMKYRGGDWEDMGATEMGRLVERGVHDNKGRDGA